MSKIVKKAKKVIQKVIPKEIKPFVAPIAAYYLGPMALKGLGGAGLTGVKGFLARAAASGVTSAATQKLVEDDVSKSSTLLSALSGGLGAGYGPNVGTETAQGIRAAKTVPAYDFDKISMLDKAKNIGLEGVAKATEALTPTTGKGIAKLVGGTGMAASAEKNYELMQKELDEYNASLGQQGIEDLGERRDLIRRYMANAGFDESQVNDALTRYGYLANGGRVGYQMGGDVSYTDFGRSGVIYRDPQGNPISKEEFLSQTDEMEGIPSIRMKGEATPVYLKDSILKDPRFTQSMEGIESLSNVLKSGMEEDRVMSPEEYKRGMNQYRQLEKMIEPYGEEISSRADKYEEGNIDLSDRFPVEAMVADKMIQDKEKQFEALSEAYTKDPGIRKDAERILNSSDFKKWKSNLTSKDPKKRLIAEADPRADYFDQIYFMFDRPGYMKEIRNYDMMSEKEGSFKDGGIINLKGKEMDLRGGGFVPIGKKERADDVPARLSKNEFVMTANAVKGAGNGDINKGVKKMYNTMRMLEGRLA